MKKPIVVMFSSYFVLFCCSSERGANSVSGSETTQDSLSETSDFGNSLGNDTETQSDLPISTQELTSEPDPACTQPDHVANCADGWCRVEPGCFQFGSYREVDFCRKNSSQDEPVIVNLTHAFEMYRHEVTQAEWMAIGLYGDFRGMPCEDCPAFASWYEALVYCNALSQKAGFETCYDLSCCEGRVGVPDPNVEGYSEFHCLCDVEKYPVPYDCPGYRLPTTAEWEYAARAGTTTQTYNGDLSPETAESEFVVDLVMDDIAWYAPNSDMRLHAVEQKKPNALGLFDMQGNILEWCSDRNRNQPLERTSEQVPPLIDPFVVFEGSTRTVRGGYFGFSACSCRVSTAFGLLPYDRSSGFRPVRTLFEER